MSLFRALLGMAAVAATGAAVAGKIVNDKKRQEELNEFLVPEVDEPVVMDIPENEDVLDMDIRSLKGQDISNVLFIFKVQDAQSAHELQRLAAEEHMGSTYDDEAGTVEIVYQESFGETELQNLYKILKDISKECGATYKKYHFE